MLRLVYRTAVFGPINLDYDQAVVRVGRSEDNDLVLPHPSVEPYHCQLLFRGEAVVWLPADARISSQTDLRSLTGSEYGEGDQLLIGELQFNLDHSSQTVAVPDMVSPEAQAGEPDGLLTSGDGSPRERRYYCAHCRKLYRSGEIKWLGLVGHAKHSLCPACSYPVELEPEPEEAISGLKRWLRKAGRGLTALLRFGRHT